MTQSTISWKDFQRCSEHKWLRCSRNRAGTSSSQLEVRILIDENLDWRLGRDLPGHQVESVSRMGWAGLKNGALLAEADKEFDILLTMDGGMAHQQNLSRFRIAVIALKARSNRLADTCALIPEVLRTLASVKPGTFTVVS